MCNFTPEIINSRREAIWVITCFWGASGFFGGPVDFLIHWPPGPVVATVQCQGLKGLLLLLCHVSIILSMLLLRSSPKLSDHLPSANIWSRTRAVCNVRHNSVQSIHVEWLMEVLSQCVLSRTRLIVALRTGSLYTGMDKLVCTPASNSLIACPGGIVSRLYRHIRQAAIPARVVLGTAVF